MACHHSRRYEVCEADFEKGLTEMNIAEQIVCDNVVELEVEEEARNSGKEGHQPIHQGTLRVQSQACLKDREGTCHEEAEGGFEFNFQMICTSMKLWRAVLPSFNHSASCTDPIWIHLVVFVRNRKKTTPNRSQFKLCDFILLICSRHCRTCLCA